MTMTKAKTVAMRPLLTEGFVDRLATLIPVESSPELYEMLTTDPFNDKVLMWLDECFEAMTKRDLLAAMRLGMLIQHEYLVSADLNKAQMRLNERFEAMTKPDRLAAMLLSMNVLHQRLVSADPSSLVGC